MERADFLIAGAGIVGLTLARALAEKQPRAKIVVLEKEPSLGCHASGRNREDLHSKNLSCPGNFLGRALRRRFYPTETIFNQCH